ncbi:MAG: OmpH family outer membrane protein [Pirellulales bacterium]
MKSQLLTFGVLAIVLSSISVAVAQQQNPAGSNSSRFNIAVVDVSYVFKNYQQFRTSMDAMKEEMTSAEGQLKSERDQVQSRESERADFKVGSPEFKKLDEDIARLKAEFNLKAGRIRKDFLEREAKVYYQTYLEVSNIVKYYAQQHDIGLVLRFNGDQIDPNRRESVLRAINDPIVNQNNIDITPDILALLNRNNASAGGGVPPSAVRGGLQKR